MTLPEHGKQGIIPRNLTKTQFNLRAIFVVFKIWKRLSKKHGLKIDILGLPSLAKFNFKSKNSQAYKTFITQEMLNHKFLATNGVYLSIAHNEKILKKYSELLDEIIYKISECEKGNLDILNLLKYPVSHTTFGRLN